MLNTVLEGKKEYNQNHKIYQNQPPCLLHIQTIQIIASRTISEDFKS